MSEILVDAKKAGKQSQLLNTKQAAEFLQMSPGTLTIWRCLRRYPLKFIKIGASVRYDVRDLEEFLRKNTESGVGQFSRRSRGRAR